MVINLKNFSLNSVNEKYVERRIPNSMIHTAEGFFSSLYRRVVKSTPPINGENCCRGQMGVKPQAHMSYPVI
jgi:hypothetical protein